LKNGELPLVAEENGVEVFVTGVIKALDLSRILATTG
jgi:hypothetical protein